MKKTISDPARASLTEPERRAIDQMRSDMRKLNEGKETPMGALLSIYKNGPPGLAEAIDQMAMEVMMVELPKVSLVTKHGPDMDRKELETVESLFAAGMVYAKGQGIDVERRLTATVRDAAKLIAELIDKSVKRILLEDTKLNRHAYLDLISMHAKMVRALQGLTDVQSD